MKERSTKIVKADVLLNGEAVDPVDSTVFPGITIDSKLQWGRYRVQVVLVQDKI